MRVVVIVAFTLNRMSVVTCQNLAKNFRRVVTKVLEPSIDVQSTHTAYYVARERVRKPEEGPLKSCLVLVLKN